MAAELAGVHPQTLRIYERKGLLDPARTGGGSRRYSDADIERLRRIQELTNRRPQPGGRASGCSSSKERAATRCATSLERARRRGPSAVDEVSRRHRRDLVPRVAIGGGVRAPSR